MRSARPLTSRPFLSRSFLFAFIFFLVANLSLPSFAKEKASADQPIQVLDEPTPTPLPVATPTAAPTPKPRAIVNETNAKTLVLHKPATNPAWGRVVEYHKENAQSNVDKTVETQHVFLFQDDQGVVRTAIFHENTSGDGYWEVLVWDR